MQQHPGIGLGGFRKPPTSVERTVACAHRQMILPCRQPATDSAIIVSGCSRPVGARIGLRAVRGAHQGLATVPVGCPGSWGLGGGLGESFASHSRLGPPSRRPPGHQNQSWRQSCPQTAVLSRIPHKPTRLPSLVGKMSLVRDATRFFRLVVPFVECKEQKSYMFPNETGPAVLSCPSGRM